MATLGVLILWFGWFGFNAGSTTSMDDGNFARVAFVTNLAAASGALMSLLFYWVKFKYADLSITLNGALAGLVSITAGCYTMTPFGAMMVGAIGGIIVFFSVFILEKLKIDDAVGAVSVHGVGGAWGTIACAIPFFCRPGEEANLMTQLTGVGAVFIFVFPVSLILFLLLKKTIGVRVTEQEELEGLDVFEHGNAGYHLNL